MNEKTKLPIPDFSSHKNIYEKSEIFFNEMKENQNINVIKVENIINKYH